MKKSIIFNLLNLSSIVSKVIPIIIFILLFVSAFFETLSFLFFYPLFKVLNGESIREEKFMYYLNKVIPTQNYNEIYVILTLIASIFCLKFLISFITTFVQNNYLTKVRLKISEKLFSDIVDREILYHGGNNKNIMLNNLTSQVHELIVNGLNPMFIFFAESITLSLFLAAILLTIPSEIVLILFIGIIIIVIIFLLINKKIKIYGEERQVYEESRINFIQNTLNSILEIKIYGQEKQIVSKYQSQDGNYFNVIKNQTILSTYSRSIVEVLVVFIFLFITFYFVNANPGIKIISSLGLLGVMILRLLPSVNKISNSLQFFKYINPVVINVTKLLHSAKEHAIKPYVTSIVNFEKIELKNIAYSYPDSNECLLNDVNISISKNEIIGLKGESGAGKSTILNLIVGLIRPGKGEILINHQNVDNGIKLGSTLSYVPQKIFINNDTLRNNILFSAGSANVSDDKIWEVLELVELASIIKEKFGDDINVMLNSDGSTFSGGQRQRIGLARALINDPQIIILDEATSGIDKVTELKIINKIIERFKITIIFISHSENLFNFCDKIYLVHDNTVKQIKNHKNKYSEL